MPASAQTLWRHVPHINYPTVLRPFTGRRVWCSTIDGIAQTSESWPIFIKSIEDKRFTGIIVRNTGDLARCGSATMMLSTDVLIIAFWRKSMCNHSSNAALFPYYINQNRLLDIYASLYDGYESYEEVTTQNEGKSSNTKRMSSNASLGFRIFNIGGSVDVNDDQSSSNSKQRTSKRFQTPTSMLMRVINTLHANKYIKDINKANSGSFIVVPATFRINSIRGLIKEAKRLTALSEKMKSLDNKNMGKRNGSSNSLNTLNRIEKVVDDLFESEEIVHDAEEFALVGTINDSYLYQASRRDIIDTSLSCLAQVKRVFPQGTQLMRDTLFANIVDSDLKEALLSSLRKIEDDGNYQFQCKVIPEITDKPVYQIEVIALYQSTDEATKTRQP